MGKLTYASAQKCPSLSRFQRLDFFTVVQIALLWPLYSTVEI